MPLRIYADFNSGSGSLNDPCWCLRYGTPLRPLDDIAESLELRDGMSVTLYYEDPSEEFEVDGVLIRSGNRVHTWRARADWETMRRLRG